jgi:DNA-binding NtrC family response regulator
MKHILVASNNREACDTIRRCFDGEYKVETTLSGESCLNSFRRKRYEFTFVDVEFLKTSVPKKDYKEALQQFWQVFPTAEIVVMSSQQMLREAVMAVKAGASNYLTYPIDKEEARYIVQSLYESLRTESELEFLRESFWQPDSLELVRTESTAMQEVLDRIRAVAPTRSTVLLSGETGTGKGRLAKLIHTHSSRSGRQFISVHCGAIPDTLLESELFGHEKGAFTGAIRRKLGKFEIAHGGTILLDEIGTITPAAQIKLLQVLQDKTFQRVGGEASIGVDVRIIAATNTDLKKMVDDGLFRKDLYYRLSVFPIEIPPLRERIEDVPTIASSVLRNLNRLHTKQIHDMDSRIIEAFDRYSWPGNIRELENLMERAYILENSHVLSPESFPSELFAFGPARPNIPIDFSRSLEDVRDQAIEEIERRYLREILTAHKGRIDPTAKIAGISVRQLHNLMKKHGLRKEEYKVGVGRIHKPEV